MKSRLFLVTVTLAICAFSISATADTAVQQEAVIVTSTRLADDATRLPSSVTIITAEDIRRSPAKTLPELLALQAGVSTRSLFGNHATDSTVDLRGFGITSTQNTLILLDGRRLNDIDLSEVNYTAIPLENIAHIEIIRGGGGVLYGDGAVGGAINIVTKTPGRAGTTGIVTVTGESYNTKQLDASVTRGNGPFTFNIFANGIDSGGYRRNNALRQSDFQSDMRWSEDQGEWFLKLGADDQRLRLPGVRTVNPILGVNELNNDRRGTDTPHDFADQTGYLLTPGYHYFLSTDRELTIDGSYRTKNQTAFFADDKDGGQFSSFVDTDIATGSFTPRLKMGHALFGQPGSFTTGLDYYQTQYNSDRSLNPSTAGTPIHRLNVSQSNIAVYGENIYEVTTNSTFTAGARLQRVRMQAHDDFNPNAPSPPFGSGGAPDRNSTDNQHMLDLGLRQRLSEEWSVYGKLGRSVRFATVDEFFQTDPNNFLQTFSPLKPQTAETIDLGTDYTHGNTRFSVGIYRMDLHNEIHFNPTTFANENLDPTRRHGVTLSAAQPLAEKWRVTADYAYTRAVFREGIFAGNEVPLVSRDTGSLSFLWMPKDSLTLSAAARYTGEKRFDSDETNTFQKIPAYTTVDLKVTGGDNVWKWQAAVNNLFGKNAFDYGVRSTFTPDTYSAYPLPGRNMSFSLGRNF